MCPLDRTVQRTGASKENNSPEDGAVHIVMSNLLATGLLLSCTAVKISISEGLIRKNISIKNTSETGRKIK